MEANGDQNQPKRELRSFLMARDPSIDRRFRPRPDRRVKLFDDTEGLVEESESSSSEEEEETTNTFELTASSVCENSALVYLRLRPVDMPSAAYKISEEGNGNVLIAGALSESSGSGCNSKDLMQNHYRFSAIFDSSVDQKQVYEKCIGQKVETEENFTILMYGTSGSGKTFTLLGDDSHPGIIPRAVENIFTLYAENIYPQPALKLIKSHVTVMNDDAIAKEVGIRRLILGASQEISAEHDRLQQIICKDHDFQTVELADVSVLIWISFVEIYNELVYDLLDMSSTTAPQNSMTAPKRENLKVVGNDGKVFIKGLTSVYVKSSREALKLLRYGLQHVSYASTAVNENSSRSHCIFFVDVLKYFKSGQITETSYKFCDLAGSERLGKTKNVGTRLTEAKRINTSLLTLGRCLDAANNNRKKPKEVIPYRDSRLTMVLQAALLGKERLIMIVNVTPMDKFYEENRNVLGFASIAKNILFKQPIVKPVKSRFSFLMERHFNGNAENNNAGNEQMQQLLNENIFLRSEVNRLTSEINHRLLKQEIDLRNKLVDSFEKTLANNRIQSEKLKNQEIDIQKRFYESKIAALKRDYEGQLEDLQDELDEYEKLPRKRRTMD